MVLLSDESGAPAGLVTLEDIIEEILGSLVSESGTEPGVLGIQHTEVIDFPMEVDGRTLLVDLSKQLGVDLTNVPASTVGGLILEDSKRFLEEGEFMEYHGLRFTVVERDRRRLSRISISRPHI